MDIREISNSIDNLKLDKETRDAVIALIDSKINNDMNTFSEVLKQTQNQIAQTEKSLQKQNSQTEKSLKSEINSIKWLLGIMIAILLAILAKSFI